jgi:DNA-binding HxlR family transcriptional regulator
MVWAGQRKRKYYTTLTWLSARWKFTSKDEEEFDISRAELFEALGHHTRIGILQSLEERPMSFSELKKKVGIESNGLLSFHLGKLTHLVSPNQEGAYALTEQGKEAVRMIRITGSGGGEEHTIKVRGQGRKSFIVIIAVLLAVVIILGSVAVYQQNQLGTMSSNVVLSHNQVFVYGTLSAGLDWVTGITVTSHTSQINFTSAAGAMVSVVPDATGLYYVSLAGGQRYNVSFTWRTTISCSSPCGSILGSSFGTFGNASAELVTCPTGGCPSFPFVHCSNIQVTPLSANSTTAKSSGSCTGAVLDLYSSTGWYNYDLSIWEEMNCNRNAEVGKGLASIDKGNPTGFEPKLA